MTSQEPTNRPRMSPDPNWFGLTFGTLVVARGDNHVIICAEPRPYRKEDGHRPQPLRSQHLAQRAAQQTPGRTITGTDYRAP
jgi:hypothetical protein